MAKATQQHQESATLFAQISKPGIQSEEILDTTERSTDNEDEVLTETAMPCHDDQDDEDEHDESDFEDNFVLKRRLGRKKLSLQERLARRERNSFWRRKLERKLESDDDSESDEYENDFTNESNKTTCVPAIPIKESTDFISDISDDDGVVMLSGSSFPNQVMQRVRNDSLSFRKVQTCHEDDVIIGHKVNTTLFFSTEDFFTAISSKLDNVVTDSDVDEPLLCEVCGIDVEMTPTTTIKYPQKCFNLVYCSRDCLHWGLHFGTRTN